jgi:hypothetical protein
MRPSRKKTKTRSLPAALKNIVAVAAISLWPFIAAAEALSEAQVKAAFIYNFAKFATWPGGAFQSSQTPITLCLSGAAGALSNIEGKLVQGRVLQIRRIALRDDLRPCHLIYLTEDDKKRAPEILASLGDAPSLTIGDIEDFAQSGGMIGFFADDNAVRFEINPEAAKRASIGFSAHLLKLARIVQERQRPGARP